MKIVYLANIRLPTEKAHGLQIMETCKALAQAKNEVTLVISSIQSADEDTIFATYGISKEFSIKKIKNWNFFRLGRFGFIIKSIIFSINVRREIILNKFDVIYTRDELSVILLNKNTPQCIYEIHDTRKGLFQHLALKYATGIVAISNGLMDYCKSRDINPKKIIVAPDGVDLQKFNIPENKEYCRKKLNLPLDKKIILYSGHLYSWKGADIFAQTTLLKKFPSNTLAVIVGGTNNDIKLFKEQFGKSTNLLIAGHKTRDLIPYYLKAADILVLPNSAKEKISRLYTSPLKLFEYMASGTPIIASDLPSIREILNKSNAILVKPDDSHALVVGIETLLHNKTTAEKIATQSFNDVQKYSWNKRVENIISFITDLQNLRTTKDLTYYNKESIQYSKKRYPEKNTQYIHFLFKRRLYITREIIKKIISTFNNPSLLEIGCADGIVLNHIYNTFGSKIKSYEGIDTSPQMIEVAKKQYISTPLQFSIRESPLNLKIISYDIIIEIGVLNYAGFEYDLLNAHNLLSPNGYYICSVAGKKSLWDRLRKSDTGFNDFMTYKEYENSIKNLFQITDIKPVGLYIPYIWRIPKIATIIQPLVEYIGLIMPNFFHEKVYLLKRKI